MGSSVLRCKKPQGMNETIWDSVKSFHYWDRSGPRPSDRRLLNAMLEKIMEKIMIMEPESCCEEMVLRKAERTRGG